MVLFVIVNREVKYLLGIIYINYFKSIISMNSAHFSFTVTAILNDDYKKLRKDITGKIQDEYK